MNNLSLPTLVLNTSWQPISVVSVRKAFMKVFNDAAKLLDTETYILHDFESWAELSVFDDNKAIRHVSGHIRTPEVVVLKNYSKFPQREVKLTRRNLLIRDGFCCQYSGKKVSAKEATIDHIIPQSRGGTTVWHNVVIASLEANAKKADKTPEEAGMKLLSVPVRPNWHPVYSRFSRIASKNLYPSSWNKFINMDDIIPLEDAKK